MKLDHLMHTLEQYIPYRVLNKLDYGVEPAYLSI